MVVCVYYVHVVVVVCYTQRIYTLKTMLLKYPHIFFNNVCCFRLLSALRVLTLLVPIPDEERKLT